MFIRARARPRKDKQRGMVGKQEEVMSVDIERRVIKEEARVWGGGEVGGELRRGRDGAHDSTHDGTPTLR